MKVQLHPSFNSAALADKLTRDGSFQKVVEPQPYSGVKRQNVLRKIMLEGQPAFGNVTWSL
jgi:hypothetical protein